MMAVGFGLKGFFREAEAYRKRGAEKFRGGSRHADCAPIDAQIPFLDSHQNARLFQGGAGHSAIK